MPIIADQHIHSSFSFDSKTEMKDMIESAYKKGLKHIAFTEHNDFDYPVSKEYPKGSWELNVDSYLYDLLMARDEFYGKITIGFGIEVGMQTGCFSQNNILTNSQQFDFIIGSVHLVNGVDTYDKAFYEGRSAKEALNEYFDTVYANIQKFKNFDVLGHLDYLTRKLPNNEADYNPNEYMDKIDAILKYLVEHEKGLELNTQALVRGLKYPNPWPEVLKRYKELGGEIITVGSDAHTPDGIGGGFDKAAEFLQANGFNYYCMFVNRSPLFQSI